MSRRTELKTAIIRHLLMTGKTTRPELVALTGGRAATVFEAIDELKSDGVIGEPERHGKKTGRRAPELYCEPDYCHIIGMELYLSGCCGVIIDTNGSIIARTELRTPNPRRSLADARREILLLLQRLRDISADKWDLIKGIGFADPGLVDLRKNRSIKAVNLPGWENLATGEWLTKASGIKANIWPEAMVKTRMEYLTRYPQMPESLFHLGTDDGIGGGFIKNGELFAGSTGRGMEIGHLVIQPDGPRCQCGNSGCLEAVAGEGAVAAKVAEAVAGNVDIPLNGEFSMAEFCNCVKHNKGARIIADDICNAIGSALAQVVTLLNPELIVISGGLTALDELLLDSVRRELELKCFPEAVKELKIELSKLGRFDTARGAAVMMRDRLLVGDI